MKISFQTIDGTHYLCAEYGGGTEGDGRGIIVADRTAVGSWEEFTPVKGEDGRWGFQARNGSWLSAQPDGQIIANRIRPEGYLPTAWEAFTVVKHGDGTMSLRTDHGLYICAEGEGGSTVIGNRTAANAWECFRPSQDFTLGDTPVDIVLLPLRVQGRFWVDANGATYRPRFCSLLSILRRSVEEQATLLDWARATGFNGCRIFAGALSWAGMTPASALAHLPKFLDLAVERGLVVEVTALTDTGVGVGYNEQEHVRKVATICALYTNVMFEVANEFWHPTQSDAVHWPGNLLAWRQSGVPSFIVSSIGAPETDEPEGSYPFADYLTLHLDRGRDKWNQVRRVRELEASSARYGKPVLNNEPMGADELDGSQTGRQRFNDPSFFFCMGALNRLSEVGGVHHSQHGLEALMPGSIQQACAEAHLAGWRAVHFTSERLSFQNAGWPTSPVKSADFDHTIVRAYSGISGNKGAVVLVGLRGDPKLELQNGWSLGAVLAEVSGCRVQEVVR